MRKFFKISIKYINPTDDGEQQLKTLNNFTVTLFKGFTVTSFKETKQQRFKNATVTINFKANCKAQRGNG